MKNLKVYGMLGNKLGYFGEAIGYDNDTLYVEMPQTKIGQKPVLEVVNFDDKVIIQEE
jgi:hypothetical protein